MERLNVNKKFGDLKMLSWILVNIKGIGVLIFGFFSLVILSCNRNLKQKNNDLQEKVKGNSKLLIIHSKVLNVSETVKPVNIDVNIKRMQDGKL